MKCFKWNYYSIFLMLFRSIIIIESLYFIVTLKYPDVLYCTLTLIATFIVDFIYKLAKLNVSTFIKFIVQFFIFLSMFLGHINKMYHHIPTWDDILHVSSGFIISIFAYLILNAFNKEGNKITNKYFTVLFIMVFSIAMAGIWEMFEFTTDYLFSLTSQGGSLSDTMLDIINGSIGPLIVSLVYLFKPNIFNKLKNNP